MKKFENFLLSFQNLKEIYDYNEPYSNVELTGLVGLYEICFEQAWKAMKEILENHGFEESKTGSPKQILKTAYQANMIQNEELWLDALVSRNNVTHSYNRVIALDIVNRTKKDYFMLFETLKKELEEKWL
jgi:nucleotidyltransferase substrate binding protein (TIGR01987 family)